MLVLHGLWTAAGELAVWAEQATAGTGGEGGAHPFAVPGDRLRAVLGGTGEPGTGHLPLALPTVDGVPCASPELGRPEVPAGAPGRPVLGEWRVPVLRYPPAGAFTLLSTPSGGGDGTAAWPAPPGGWDDGSAPTDVDGSDVDGSDVDGVGPEVVSGASLRHLRAVAGFAADLVRRGRVLPAVHAGPDGARAAWRPVLAGADAEWLRDLAAALPPSGRAERDAGAERPAAAVVVAAVEGLCDAAARAALCGWSPGPGPAGTPDLAAALSGDPRLTGTPAQAAGLAERLVAWQRDAAGGPVRACFRLVEPDDEPVDTDPVDTDRGVPDSGDPGDPGPWRVRFALVPHAEPSLLVDAADVWSSPRAQRALRRHCDDPQETLLAELGRACRLWPELADGLRTARPAELVLDAAGAHRFLREAAPALHAAGFGVLLPSWWGSSPPRLGARLAARGRTAPGTVAGRSALGMDALVEYQWQVMLGDQSLTGAELAELAAVKAPLVRVRGRWVEVDPGRLAAGLGLLGRGQRITVGELLRDGLADDVSPAGLPVVEVTADGPLGELLAGSVEHRLAPRRPGARFTGTLRPYQERGLAWLSFLEELGLGMVLADDMGLGKTVQLLALLAGDPATAGPTLLVCPMSLVGNWQREARRFAPALRVHVHHGAERTRGEEFAEVVRGTDLMLTTYGLAARDAADLAGTAWHRVVLDEAQAIKNAATRQATAVRALPARHRIAVTGTPVENRLADLWSIMDFANPGLLGDAATFRRRYAEPVERYGDEAVAARLRRLTGPFILRRRKTDPDIVPDLPAKLEMEVACTLTAEQASLYQAVVADMLDRIEATEGIERRGLVLATMTRLKQVCNHPAQLLRDGSRLAGRSGKLSRVEEILDEVLAAGEKALLFTQYAGFGAALRGHLTARFGREVLFLHGGVDRAGRDGMVRRFQAGGAAGPPVFVLSLKAGGTGLNLTAANHVIHVDRWWNPAVEDQATDRAFRIGQRRAVQVRALVCAGTVEEKIAAMLREKRGLAAAAVGGGERWLTELSTAELRELLRLEPGAVVE